MVSTMAAPVRTRSGPPGDRPAAERQLDQLRFLHRVAKLATTARTWDELLETIVDETRDALHGDVSSLYLLDRDGIHLTLAATNGLDRYQIGRARVPFGEGVTGRVAASRLPMRIADVRHDPRFLWVRGIDQRRFIASMLSVPLSWHEAVVGVLNIQTEETREFSDSDVAQLSAIADLLAGIVEKGRTQREAEAQVEALKALDEARSELIAMVTHELRTPLAVVRAYTDLLSEEPPLIGRESRDMVRRRTRDEWHNRAIDQIDRLDRLVDSILASVRPLEDQPSDVVPIDVPGLLDEVVGGLRPLLRNHVVVVDPGIRRFALADPPRLRQIVEHLIENAVKYAPPGTTISVGATLHEGSVRIAVSDEGPGIPAEWRERIFEPYARRDTHTARGSGIGLFAAKRLAESMHGHLWCEPAEPAGARFVIALPAAVAV